MHLHRAMAIFILNKTSRLEPKSQKRVESAVEHANGNVVDPRLMPLDEVFERLPTA